MSTRAAPPMPDDAEDGQAAGRPPPAAAEKRGRQPSTADYRSAVQLQGRVRSGTPLVSNLHIVGGATDGRRKLIRLTPRGVDSLVQSAEIFDELRADWVGKLGAARVSELEDSLRTVVPRTGFPLDVPGWFG